MKKPTLRNRIEKRIALKVARKNDSVFLTREFTDLGGEDQVIRALRCLVRDGKLIKLGYGVYGRAFTSRLSGKPVLFNPNGFAGAAREALNKLGIDWKPTEAERAYNEGRSTQIPVNTVVCIKERFSRKLSNGNVELIIDKA